LLRVEATSATANTSPNKLRQRIQELELVIPVHYEFVASCPSRSPRLKLMNFGPVGKRIPGNQETHDLSVVFGLQGYPIG
jgi:hypothetical protein